MCNANIELYYINILIENFLLKLDKDENIEMLLVYCIIHRDILISKYLPYIFNKILKSFIKYSNALKFKIQ